VGLEHASSRPRDGAIDVERRRVEVDLPRAARREHRGLRGVRVDLARRLVEHVCAQTPFKDLGIDSMMAIEIVADVERQFQLSIPEDELKDLTNLEAVYTKVKEKLAAKG
jgi:acyl carrier protein